MFFKKVERFRANYAILLSEARMGGLVIRFKKFGSVDDYQNWLPSAKQLIQSQCPRVFDVYTNFYTDISSVAVYAIIDEDYIYNISQEEADTLLSEEEALSDGMCKNVETL